MGLLQLLSVARGLYEACGLQMSGPLEHLDIPPLPAWANKICAQLRVTLFKRFVDLNPGEDPMPWRNFGRIVGVGLRELGFIEHDVRCESEVPAEDDVAGKLAGLDELLATVLNGSHMDALFAHYGRSLESYVRIGLGQTPAEQYEFLAGLAEGQTLVFDTQGQFVGDRGRTTVYCELLSRWPEIEQMRQSVPRQSCANLYQLIAPGLGDPRRERFDWFYGVCKEIGLSLGVEGRPPKSARK